MSVLLYLPGLLVILFKRRGLVSTMRHMLTIVATQALLAANFLDGDRWAYLRSSFDFSRVFLYKWTVNWRLIDEDTFLSPGWAKGLLIGHASVLVAFGLFRWCRPDGGVWPVLARGLRKPLRPAALAPLSADCESILPTGAFKSVIFEIDVATVFFTSNLIGIIFARSLHYQFYSWYAQQVPFLAWKTRYPFLVK